MPARSVRVVPFLISAFLCACTADFTDEAPSQSSNPFPPDSASNQSTNLELRWDASNAGSDPTFDLYLGTESHPSIVAYGLTKTAFRPLGLRRNATYHWRVDAINAGGLVKGGHWTFTTTAGTSPDVPANVSPEDGSDQAVDHIVLRWSAGDADHDSLRFDVYFGKEANPPLALADVRYGAVGMSVPERVTYYWRVVARDTFGLSSESPTWSFNAVPIPGHVYYWAGTGAAGTGAVGQLPSQTALHWPVDVAFAPDGTPYVVDWNNHRILAVDASGHFTLIAGTADGQLGDPCTSAPAGCQDVVAAGAKLNQPAHVAFDANGNVVLSAWHNYLLFLLDMNSGLMDRIAGGGVAFRDGELATDTFVNRAASAVFGPDGRLYYTDQAHMVIRMIDENGIVHTVAGTDPVWSEALGWQVQFGYSGDGGPASAALLFFDRGPTMMPSGRICFDAAGNMYIADTMNRCVRKVDPNGIIHLFAGRPPGYLYSDLAEPRDVAVDSHGNVFIADSGRSQILWVNPLGYVGSVAGMNGHFGDDDRDGTEGYRTTLNAPFGIAIDARDNVWIADTKNSRIRILYR